MKENIHNSEDNIPNYFHERDIWWYRLGVNIGFEQDGKGSDSSRPVLIIKKFTRHVAWIIPLTDKIGAINHIEFAHIKKTIRDLL